MFYLALLLAIASFAIKKMVFLDILIFLFFAFQGYSQFIY